MTRTLPFCLTLSQQQQLYTRAHDLFQFRITSVHNDTCFHMGVTVRTAPTTHHEHSMSKQANLASPDQSSQQPVLDSPSPVVSRSDARGHASVPSPAASASSSGASGGSQLA